ncbi:MULTISPECIES: phosphoadenylyl-sulfate reductase [unclassified Arcicella]|uniref:phosphoadenylyl-sulfate reductase n=1 Tax=unclassified Arcicella TaxID=2644986 RepID=UPI0028663FC3|nr:MULTISPECIES: phosphoadenylyl-sulfate reductase [unclassified Arcicella]MDR6564893.1 phosphoadenosine phosphosulfate reductase [Arcicella sp. BE51]MDR6814683.1 phosphoadenosine phosphosulfate reductase [Arcicella sp. BE140]MDR6826154.1 phosphoadenosine phosphosulfate reductase [Arcicella sp. BE139]
MSDLSQLKQALEGLSLTEGLSYMAENYGNVVFSSSFGQEDQVITDAIFKNNLPIKVFTLDTGRLFQETYELMDTTKNKYGKEFETYFPNTAKVEALVKEKGFNSFYFSVENRKECCGIRKIEPLKRALAGAEIWITGLRAEQSENRSDMEIVEWDNNNNVIKYNPLIHWTYEDVLAYLKENRVPDSPLHRKGFISIGCAPCTRAIQEGEHPRAGRWWWEASQKECGLHS